jgi:hypothetical protein
MNKRRFQPRKIKAGQLLRFRGVLDPDSSHNMSDAYVGSQSNLESTKIRQLDQRNGHVIDDVVSDGSYASGINTGSKHIIGTVMGEGTRLWAKLRRLFVRRDIIEYVPPTLPDPPPLPPLPPIPPPPVPPPVPPPDIPPPLPPLPPPDDPPGPGEYDFKIDVSPESFEMYATTGYDAADYVAEIELEFNNYDNLSTQEEIENRVKAFFSGALFTDNGLSFDLLAGNRIRVTQSLGLKPGLGVTNIDTRIYMSSGYSYAITNARVRVDQAAQTGLPWRNLYDAVNERRWANAGDYGGAIYVPPVPFEDLDFNDYQTQKDMIYNAQEFVVNGQERSDIFYIRSKETSFLEGNPYYTVWTDWNWIKTTAGLNPAGFERISGGVLVGYGYIQDGDDIDIHLFNELHNCYELLKHVMVEIRNEEGGNSSDPFGYPSAPRLGDVTDDAGATKSSYLKTTRYDGVVTTFDFWAWFYAEYYGSDPYYSVSSTGTIEVPQKDPIAPVEFEDVDIFIEALDNWADIMLAQKSFSIPNGAAPSTDYYRITSLQNLNIGTSIGISMSLDAVDAYADSRLYAAWSLKNPTSIIQ